MSGTHTLFISYRRNDASGWAGRLQADLRTRLGPGTEVFMDVDGIPAGEEFARYIDDVVGQSDALIALIGPQWAGRAHDGGSRLADPKDFVRLEIESAFRRGIRVIPALLDGVPLPREDELPMSLQPLIQREAIQFTNASWDPMMERLVGSLTRSNQAPPDLALSNERLDFGTLTVQDNWPRTTVQLRNEGGGRLTATSTTDESWIVLRNRQDAIDVLVDTSHPGEYAGRITVSSNGGTATILVTASIQQRRAAQPPPTPTPAAINQVPRAAGPPPGYVQYPPVYAQPVMPMVPTNMTMAIIALLLFFPTGIPSVVFAAKVNPLRQRGDLRGAESASRTARTWAIVSYVLITLIVLGAIGAGTSSQPTQ